MIRKLVVHRFRGIRSGVIEDIGKINVLIGPNNSGKSAVLELLYLSGLCGHPCGLILEQTGQAWEAMTLLPRDFLGYEPMPRLRQRHGKSALWKENPAAITPEGGISVELAELPEDFPLRRFRLGAPLERLGEKSKRFIRKDIERISLFSLTETEDLPPSMVPDLLREHRSISGTQRWHYLWEPDWVYFWEREAPIDNVAIWSTEGIQPDAERVVFCDLHVTTGHFPSFFAKWAKDNVAGWYDDTAQYLGAVFPPLQGALVEVDGTPDKEKGEAIYVRFRGQKRVLVDFYGDGTRHAAKVLAALVALAKSVDESHPGLFLWEDPELFMHPASLARLLGEVMRIVAERPIQVFISTQSLEVLAWLAKYLEGQPVINPEEVRTFRLDLEMGQLIVEPFVGRAIGRWMKFIGDPRFASVKEEEFYSPLSYYLLREEY